MGQEYEVEENRIEAICGRDRVEAVVGAIVEAHPYETPAITIYPTLTGEYKYWADSGMGRFLGYIPLGDPQAAGLSLV